MKYSLAVLVGLFLIGIGVCDANRRPRKSEDEEDEGFLSTGNILAPFGYLIDGVKEGAALLEEIGSNVLNTAGQAGTKLKRSLTGNQQTFPLEDVTDTMRRTSNQWERTASDTAREGIKTGKALANKLPRLFSGDLTDRIQAEPEKLRHTASDIYNIAGERSTKTRPIRARREESQDDLNYRPKQGRREDEESQYDRDSRPIRARRENQYDRDNRPTRTRNEERQDDRDSRPLRATGEESQYDRDY